MRLTVFTDYSLRVLLMLAAQPQRVVTISEVANRFNISRAHLMKVTHTLARTRWVETLRGRGGGMRLGIDPALLTLRQIIATLENDFALVECFGPRNRCVLTGGCGVERALGRALRMFYQELDGYTLAQLAQVSKPRLCEK